MVGWIKNVLCAQLLLQIPNDLQHKFLFSSVCECPYDFLHGTETCSVSSIGTGN